MKEKNRSLWVAAPDHPKLSPLDSAGFQTRRPLVAGAAPIDIGAADLEGLWSLRFGMFGCADSETRGGVVRIGTGLLVGGDSTFAYIGRWHVSAGELRATLDIARHSRNGVATSIFGIREDVYHADCIAHAITPDLFEGRILRPCHPDARMTMRRMDLGSGSLSTDRP